MRKFAVMKSNESLKKSYLINNQRPIVHLLYPSPRCARKRQSRLLRHEKENRVAKRCVW